MNLKFNVKVHVKRLHLPQSPEVHTTISAKLLRVWHIGQAKKIRRDFRKKTTTKKTKVEQPRPAVKLWGTVDIHKYEAVV